MDGDGRVLHATLDLLDRQLRDRRGVLCGNVDDLELQQSDDGEWYVSAILTGPGALAYRLGARRLGEWLRSADSRMNGRDTDRTRVPVELAHRIGSSIDLAVDAADLASHAFERWVRDHVVGPVPGSGRHADE